MTSPASPSSRRLVAVGLVVSLLLAVAVSLLASSRPDGLEYVAEGLGFSQSATDSPAAASPLSDYETDAEGLGGIGDGTPLAGFVGVVLTGAVAFVLFRRLGRAP